MTFSTKSSLKILLSVLPLCILFACGKDNRKPAHLLTHEQMVKALVHIYTTEQKLSIGLSADSAKTVFKKMEGRMFKDIGVSDSTFKMSYDYYMERPQEFELIYTALVDTLNLYEQRSKVAE